MLWGNEWYRCRRSMRFRISLMAVLSVFVMGTVSFVAQWKERREEYAKGQEKLREQEVEQASDLTFMALSWKRYGMEPRLSALIDDSEGSLLPTHMEYNAYEVNDFYVQNNLTNPLVERDTPISWAFIVTLFLSFIALLLSYDAVSGEKRAGTLSFSLSYAVSRFSFLLAKFFSVIVAVGVMLLSGVAVSLLLVFCLGASPFNGMFGAEVLGFLFFSLLFIALFTSLGLLASVLTRHTIVSALTCVFFWLLFLVLIPNSAIFLANRFFPLSRTAEEVEREILRQQKELHDAAPPLSWGNREREPFYPAHELRAALRQRILDMKLEQQQSYHADMFHQYESTQRLLLFSPFAQYKRMNEIWLDGGYLRFQKNWKQLHCFQKEFLAWFKVKDAQDAESPHWYNSKENLSTSRKPVPVAEIPHYLEPIIRLNERLFAVTGYVLLLLGEVLLLLALAYGVFRRYDVR